MNNDDFENKARSVLDDSVENLDSHTSRQLFEARQKALAELHKPAWWQMPVLKPVGAVVAGLLIFMLVNPVYRLAENETGLSQPADIEMMASVESLEMVEDLEMMQWLLESDDYAG